jgi:glycerate kinase
MDMTIRGQESPPRVVVALDKFKGSLRAADAVDAVARGILRASPIAVVDRAPVADGGDGTVDAAVSAGFAAHHIHVSGPRGAAVRATVAVRDGVAVIEVANTSGLELMRPEGLDALGAHSYAVGEAIKAALDLGAQQIVVGLGGSASTDGGSGMLRALGARFLDDHDDELPLGGRGLERLWRVDLSALDDRIPRTHFVMASDVDNPLLGAAGSAAVFAPQKGADAAAVSLLERALGRFAEVSARVGGQRFEREPGAGAAGGIGFAGLAYLGATMDSGARIVLELLGLRQTLGGADLVVTGEGRLDEQSLNGKAPLAVANAASALGIPVVAIVGSMSLGAERAAASGFDAVYELLAEEPDVSVCMRDTARLLSTMGETLVRDGWVTYGVGEGKPPV